MKESILNWIKSLYYYKTNGKILFDSNAYESHQVFWSIGMFLALLLGCYIIWFISRFLFVQLSLLFFDRTKTKWDDYLIKNKFFKALAVLIPLMFVEHFLEIAFFNYPKALTFFLKLLDGVIIFAIIIIVNRFLT